MVFCAALINNRPRGIEIKMHPWATEDQFGLTIRVLVAPRSSKTRIIGEHDGHLKIAIASPPVDGAANESLISFLAKLLRIPKTSIDLLSGQSSRKKVVRLPRTETTQNFVTS